jgi:Fe-S cluster biogenesis protein NfuA
MSTVPVEIQLEFTPNPNTLKYALNRRILITGAEYYKNAEEAEQYSPLALKLFQLEAISAVMLGPDFVTITLSNQDNLRELNRSVLATIREHLEAGETIAIPRDETDHADESDVERRIRELLENEIRPAVAMDGGDITFEGYDDGTVYLFLKGACAGCPSATMTLQMGIETRLRDILGDDFKEIVPIS